MSLAVKAEARECKGCGAEIPAQPSGPGRPREFCGRRCRRDYYHRLEQAAIEAERAEAREAQRYETDRRFYGKRKADQLAKERRTRREGDQ